MARRLSVRLASFVTFFAGLVATSLASAQTEDTPTPPPNTDDDRARSAEPSVTPPGPPPMPPVSAPPVARAPKTEAVRYPLSRAGRPLTVPKLYLTATLDLSTTHWAAGRFTDATVGAGIGITDDLAVRAVVAPIQLTSPSRAAFGGVHYGETSGTQGPTLNATYRFLRGDVELGAFVGGQVLTAFNISGYRLMLGVPFRAHVAKSVRLDVSPEMTFTHQTNEAVPVGGTTIGPQGTISVTSIGSSPVAVSQTTEHYGLFIPLDLVWNMTELVHVGVNTGYVVSDLSLVKNSMRIPFGLSGGYTVAGARGPLLDIDPYFDFPALFRPASSAKKTQTDWNEIGITFRAHVDFL